MLTIVKRNLPPRKVLFIILRMLAVIFASPVLTVPLPVFLDALLPPVFASIYTLFTKLPVLLTVISVSLSVLDDAVLLLSDPVFLFSAEIVPSGFIVKLK